MTYDKKTRTITIDGDEEQLRKDTFEYFADVNEQVERELKQKKRKKSRFRPLKRSTRVSIVIFVAWTIYVFFRTADDYEIMGVRLNNWSDDYLLANWLAIPFCIFVFYKALKWALKDSNGKV